VPLIGFDPDLPQGYLNMDRILFLDFDGVLHPDAADTDMYFCYMTEFCDVLRQVDPNGEMPIVVSSMWRFTDRIPCLRSHFPDDVARRIVGVTPDLFDSDDERNSGSRGWGMAGSAKGDSNYGSREREILAWMDKFAPAGQWLAIDDRAKYFSVQCQNLFWVPGIYEDEGCGINSIVADRLLQRLNEFIQGNNLPLNSHPS
jgi:hypothetical protein